MIKSLPWVLLVSIILCLLGCDSSMSSKGGIGDFKHTKTVTNYDETGKVKSVETEETAGVLQQPENPDSAAGIFFSYDENFKPILKIDWGGSTNVAGSIATIGLTKIPIYGGVLLILIAIPVGIFVNKSWAFIIGGVGGLMIIGSYLLATYSLYFMIGFGILLLFAGWFVYDYFKERAITQEVVKSTQIVRDLGINDKEKMNAIANRIQSKSTKKRIKWIKGE